MRLASSSLVCLITLLLLATPPAHARSRAPRLPAPSGQGERFTPSAAAALRAEPQGARSVGQLRAGQSYPLLKTGGPGGAWCKLEADGQQGWVECSAGQRGAGGGSRASAEVTEPTRNTAGRATGCATSCTRAPLFHDAVELSPVDREVLALCPARPDASVGEADVRRFFGKHVDDPRLQRALSAAGRPSSRESNIAWLTGLWVGSGPRNAFTHVFCGDDWETGKLGGLHYLPRYAQLEQEGKVCYGGPVKRVAKVGDQYLIRYQGVAPWSCGEKPVGGFPVAHDPVDLVATATRAFVRCCGKRGSQNDGGVYTAPDLNGTRWQIWCGTRNGTYGIASFYPTNDKATCAE